jgi:coenzyme Q-binding protein COQ10
MPYHEARRRIRHSAAAMFDLVADGERYPEFLPYCTGLKVLRRITGPDGRPVMLASMTVGYGPISESFVSRVILDRPNLKITVQYVDGPFRHLDNRWAFRDLPDGGSEVDFSIDYSFRSRTFELLTGSVFDKLFRRMADAFITRADALHGKEPAHIKGPGC